MHNAPVFGALWLLEGIGCETLCECTEISLRSVTDSLALILFWA